MSIYHYWTELKGCKKEIVDISHSRFPEGVEFSEGEGAACLRGDTLLEGVEGPVSTICLLVPLEGFSFSPISESLSVPVELFACMGSCFTLSGRVKSTLIWDETDNFWVGNRSDCATKLSTNFFISSSLMKRNQKRNQKRNKSKK